MRSSRVVMTLAAFLAVSIATAPALPARSADGLRPEVLDTLLKMRIVAAVLDTQVIEHPYPGPTTGLVPLASIGGAFLSRTRSLGGSARDAWSNPLLYWSDGTDYVVLSLGADGARQFAYDGPTPFANVPKGWAGSDPADDLLVVDGVVFRGPSSQAELLRRAMGELRTVGIACESFAVDNNVYPGPVAPVDAVARIAADLEPVYIRVVPKLDPWGNPYRYWSDTQHFALVSYGPDGIPDYPYAAWSLADWQGLHTGPTTEFGKDLVFVTGAFAQWPVIAQGP